MSNLFSPKSREEFLEAIDRGLLQSKNGQREDAISSIKQMSDELKAGYRAIYSTDSEKRVAHS